MMLNSVELDVDDVLVVEVGIGSMPKAAAETYMAAIKAKFKETFGTHQPMMFLAGSEIRQTSISVIQRGLRKTLGSRR